MTSLEISTLMARFQALESTMSSLGSEMSSAASNGSFADLLEEASSAMSSASSALDGSGSVGSAGDTGGVSGTSGGVTGSDVVADAKQYLGVPYQWGGTSPSTGFDCSGFVQHVYADLGISLPRTSQEQAQVGTPISSLADAQPGDLLFFEPSSSGPGHVGIYVGGGMMIDAPHTGSSVQVEQVWGTPCAIRRIVPSSSAGGSLLSTSYGSSGSQSLGASGSESPTLQALGVPSDLMGDFEQASATYSVPASLLAAVAKQESGFDPSAVSSAGAEGLMQIMPSTAAGLGVDPFDPSQAINGAAQLLSSYLNQYSGSVPLALAAYNAGPGAVSEYGGVPPYSQTQAYVADIMSSLGEAQ